MTSGLVTSNNETPISHENRRYLVSREVDKDQAKVKEKAGERERERDREKYEYRG